MKPYTLRRPLLHRRMLGMTLIELMVALAVGSFLLIGAVTVFVQSRTTFRVTDSVARLQENARFVLDAMEPDIRMANFWGMTARTTKVQRRATPADPVPPSLAVTGDCGQNWSIYLDRPVDGTNNAYAWACGAFSGLPQPNSDTLIVRRASEQPEAAQAGRLSIQSARFQDSELFVGAALPAGFSAASSQTHRLIVNGYYVSADSSLSTPGNRVPSLRRKTLGAGPTVRDEEVLPGVEDMQVQFGVDTDVVGAANRGVIDRWVNPGDALLDPVANPDVRVLAVRIWLRVRAERPEVGFSDTNSYVYADRNVPAPGDAFRRIVVSKTIYLRNARPAA